MEVNTSMTQLVKLECSTKVVCLVDGFPQLAKVCVFPTLPSRLSSGSKIGARKN